MATRGRKPGRKPKDSTITDGFNQEPKLTAAQKRQLALQKKLIAEAKKKKRAESEDPDDLIDDDSSESAYQMLMDMRYVYKKVGGRKKLEKFIKKNDKAYELMVKELMKIESSMKQAAIKKSDGPGGDGKQNVFVVLKGLEEEQRAVTIVQAVDGQSQIDMHSMSAILKPADALEDNQEIPLDEDNIIRPERG